MEEFHLATDISNPSYLAMAVSGKYLYTVNELNEYQGNPAGTVTAFAVDQTSFRIKPLNRQHSGGKGPCHITLVQNLAQSLAVVSNYSSGIISVFPLLEDGSLSELSQTIQLEGSGPDRKRQESSHAHSFIFAPCKSHGLACDLGADRIISYNIENNILVPVSQFNSAPGSGPRHLVFNLEGKLVYCLNELNSTVDVLSCSADGLEKIQTVSTLPGNCTVASTASAVKLSADARFLYTSNRGHDSIAVFGINNTGLLKQEAVIPTDGKTPRDFAIDNCGKFLLVCNQDSDNLTVFSIDQANGILYKKWEYKVPSGVCVAINRN